MWVACGPCVQGEVVVNEMKLNIDVVVLMWCVMFGGHDNERSLSIGRLGGFESGSDSLVYRSNYMNNT